LYFCVCFSFFSLNKDCVFLYNKPISKDGEDVNFQTTIVTDPSILNSSQSFSVKNQTGDTIFIISKGNIERFYGDEIMVSGNI
jgi:hypothetical protein